MKTRLIMLAAVMVLGFATTSLAATVPVGFDFTGQGGTAATSINVYVQEWDYAPSGVLTVFDHPLPIAINDIFDLYTHGYVDGLLNSANQEITVPAGYEITLVTGFSEQVYNILYPDVNNPLMSSAYFKLAGTDVNFFELYIDTTPDADSDLSSGAAGAGSGFSDGTLLFSGYVMKSTGSFTADGSQIVALDQQGPDEATSANGFSDPQLTVTGNGNSPTEIGVVPIVINRNYFFDIPESYGLQLFFNPVGTNLPFDSVDPPNYFYNGSNMASLADFGVLDQINGSGNSKGNLFLLEVDATMGQTPIPEPGTMLLLGTGLLAVGILGRKRMLRK